MDISVIIPLYKGNRYLPGLFSMMQRNAEAAPGIKAELVLIDDDPGEEIRLPSHDESLFSVKLSCNPGNVGILQSRKNGVSLAEGEYILFLDQDDEISDYALSVLFYTASGGEAAVSGWYLETEAEGGIAKVRQCYRESADFLKALLLAQNVIGPPGHCLIRKDIVEDCWKDLSLTNEGADDYYLWLSMLLDGHSFSVSSDVLYTHKYNVSSFSNDYERMSSARAEVLSLIMEKYHFSSMLKKRSEVFLNYQTQRERMVIQGASKYRMNLYYLRHLPCYLYHMYINRKIYRY